MYDLFQISLTQSLIFLNLGIPTCTCSLFLCYHIEIQLSSCHIFDILYDFGPLGAQIIAPWCTQKLCTTEVGHREPPLARASTGPRNASGGPYQTHASGAVCQCISARGVSFVGLPPGNLNLHLFLSDRMVCLMQQALRRLAAHHLLRPGTT